MSMIEEVPAGAVYQHMRHMPGAAPGIEHDEIVSLPSAGEPAHVTCIDYCPSNVQVQEVDDLETCLDRDLKNTMRLHKIIMVTFLKDLVFEEIVSRDFRISIKDIRHTLKKQITFNKLFTSRPAYHLAKVAARCGLIEDTARLGLFYADVAGGECLPPLITVADLVTGQERVTTIDSLFTQARKKAVTMMRAAFSYWKGDIGREELISGIPGQSLDTGMMGVSTSSIRYTKEDNTSPLR